MRVVAKTTLGLRPKRKSAQSSSSNQLRKVMKTVTKNSMTLLRRVMKTVTKTSMTLRRKKASDLSTGTPSKERRLAPWRSSASSGTLDRIKRATEQRLYLVAQEAIKSSSGPARKFTVLGSTGNVYVVIVDSIVSCNCPDGSRGNVCKHHLFVFLRVLGVAESSPLLYQRALLSTERAEVLSGAGRPGSKSYASASVRAAYKKATSMSPKSSSSSSHRGSNDDTCTICYESLGKEKLEVCKSCNNAVHQECFRKWAQAQRGDITCPLCRAKWQKPKNDKMLSRVSAEGYLNFGREARMSTQRDTSSYSSFFHYYHG